MYEEDESSDLNPLISRFEDMLKQGDVWYFDVQEIEAISDYYYDTGRLSKAIQAVQVGSDQHPSSPNFLLRKAQLYTAGNQLEEAEAALNSLEKMQPESVNLYMARAAYFSKSDQHQKAILFYKRAMRIAEFQEEIWPLLAMEYQVVGNYELAQKYLRLTLQENPQDEIAIYNLALCFDLLDNSEEGIRYFSRFVDKLPYSEVAWYHLGILQAKEKLYDEALVSIDYAILIDEYFTAAYYEKARILEKTYRYKEAIELYDISIENEGPTGYAFYKIGMCQMNLHNEEKAISYFTKATQEDPDLDEAFYELALLKDEMNSGAEAMHHINQAIKINPDNSDYLYVAAEIHRRSGMLNEAELMYEKLITLGHIDPDIFIDYAELLFDLCEFEQGMEILYQGVQLNPESAEIHYRLSGYLYTLQESDEANIYFKKALKMDPDRRMFFFQLFPNLMNYPSVKQLSEECLK